MKSIAKEIWDALVITHEGTSQVKENKMDSLIYQYELFKMKSNEIISQIYDRFIEIIGGIKSLGKTLKNEELVKKILRSLSKEWLFKVTSLKDSKDLSKVQLDELLRNLIDYEMTLKRKRIRKMLFQNKKFIPKRNFKKDKGESSKRDPPICYECNKSSHIRMDCPKLKKPSKKFKKKALKATWDESCHSEDEEIGDEVAILSLLDLKLKEELAKMCFMIMEESSNEVTLGDDVVEFFYDELINALKIIHDELKLSHKKNKLLKKELVSLRKENEISSKDARPLDNDMQKSLNELSLGNEKLRNEIVKLKTSLSKFAKGKDKLDVILASQRSFSIKYGLGYSKFAQVWLKSSKFESKWYLDSGCSRRPAHASMDLLTNLNKDEIVDRLPKIKFQKNNVCDASSWGISNKAYRVFNKKILVVKESMHVVFDEGNPFGPRKNVSCNDDVVGDFDDLALEDPQSSKDQDQLKEDPLKALGDDEVELQE
ncbi:uncharacterized protein LOC131173095 [Hevea brasiliensis]|uniref:uncharacterized protein LOC131173095 n=1 Tax=Hevea brasiliensis TaxID=3981 RepID=UPI0025F2D790|nr:uncharacterized protein LOC131173095 [Hevea brasiliensis]